MAASRGSQATKCHSRLRWWAVKEMVAACLVLYVETYGEWLLAAQ